MNPNPISGKNQSLLLSRKQVSKNDRISICTVSLACNAVIRTKGFGIETLLDVDKYYARIRCTMRDFSSNTMDNRTHNMKRLDKYIRIQEMNQGIMSTKKTKVWFVFARDEKVGEVKWYYGWRKYVYYNDLPGFMDWDFMRYMAEFTEKATETHKYRGLLKGQEFSRETYALAVKAERKKHGNN